MNETHFKLTVLMLIRLAAKKNNIQRRTYLGRVMSMSSTSEGHVG